MTDAERRALAKKWYDLPPNREWWQIAKVFSQLQDEGVISLDHTTMDFCAAVSWKSKHFDLFDLLVQHVLENKLLGVTQ